MRLSIPEAGSWFDLDWLRQWWEYSPRKKQRHRPLVKQWAWQGHIVKAQTKSEAHARFKELLGTRQLPTRRQAGSIKEMIS